MERIVVESDPFSPPSWVKPKKRPMLLTQNHSINRSGDSRQKMAGQITSHGSAAASDTR